MTPERLEAIREEAEDSKRYGGHFMPDDVLELLDYIDQARADAWDEGWERGYYDRAADEYHGKPLTIPNPYRKEKP